MILKGVYMESSQDSKKINSEAKIVLSGCHSLISLDNETIGDPMELAGLKGDNMVPN
jgi:hypothetical protein